jgi:hypothetical protein
LALLGLALDVNAFGVIGLALVVIAVAVVIAIAISIAISIVETLHATSLRKRGRNATTTTHETNLLITPISVNTIGVV